MEIMGQAHGHAADDTGDPATAYTKEVKDPALEIRVADGERHDCEEELYRCDICDIPIYKGINTQHYHPCNHCE